MSSILKALRKLEDEKHTQHPYEFRIDPDILKVDLPHRNSTAKFILIGLLLFAGGSAATFLFMKGDHAAGPVRKHEPSQLQTAPLALTPKAVRPSGEVELKTEVLPESIKIVPADKHGAGSKSADKITKTGNSDKTQVIAPDPSTKGKLQKQLQPAPVPLTRLQSSPSGAIPSLRVNGIAYQEGTSDNMAIINGVPVSDGSTVEGVKIECIFKNRVRFNYMGEVFEIQLGKSNR